MSCLVPCVRRHVMPSHVSLGLSVVMCCLSLCHVVSPCVSPCLFSLSCQVLSPIVSSSPVPRGILSLRSRVVSRRVWCLVVLCCMSCHVSFLFFSCHLFACDVMELRVVSCQVSGRVLSLSLACPCPRWPRAGVAVRLHIEGMD